MRAQRCPRRWSVWPIIDALADGACWLAMIVAYLLIVGALYVILTTPASGAPSKITLRATAYSWKEKSHRKWGTRNALGGCLTRPVEGLGHCAVDPRIIPLGSILEVPGVGRRIATDTGGAIKGRDLDIHFNSLREMRAWGARRVTVRVLRWGWGTNRRVGQWQKKHLKFT